MQWMVKLYDKALVWSQHKHAARYLAAISFVEASVFPIPPYFMLAPMALAQPKKAVNFALIATIASVLGGIVGYYLGYFVFKPIMLPLIEYFGYSNAYQHVIDLFDQHGLLALLILGATPMPYKIVAIGAGFLQIPLQLFLLTSLISRGVKFFAITLLIKAGGDKIEQYLRDSIAKFGLIGLGLTGLIVFVSLKVI